MGEVDYISRKAVQTRLKEIINEMETIFADIREREVDDSVCGLCEYDCDHGLDGFANECPGFEKDDCFKLKEKYRAEWLDIKKLPPVTSQEPRWIPVSERLPEDRREVLVTAYWHETYQVMMASYYGDGLWWCVPFNNCGEHMQRLNPKAWMPLPQNYREVEE